MTKTRGPRWVFDALPPSGARRGGNPADHAFAHNLGTFVREVVQNANDQAQLSPRVVFRFRPLKGMALKEFVRALEMPGLESHLVAVAKRPEAVSTSRALNRLRESQELLVLYIEDYGTEGLTGEESEGESHFRALCKDTLFSHKRDSTAGGSYGLGKSVLWIFSSFSTVLYSSTLLQLPRGRENPRFIGRAEFPSHEVAAKAFSGSGWFGIKRSLRRGHRAESVWGQDAYDLSHALGFAGRADHQVGTSICIVGFRDPTEDEDSDVGTLVERTRRSIVEYFWPAMTLKRRRLRAAVGSGDQTHNVAVDDENVRPFVLAWRKRATPDSQLARPGDVVVRDLPFAIPARRSGQPGVKGCVRLIVRLHDEHHSHPRAGQVAYFRGPGMVLDYHDRRRLSLGMRPFHAVLACGVARDPDNVEETDHAIEQFLRMAEPPSHDRWEPTQRLKDSYVRGYAKALKQLTQCVDDELKRLLVVRSTDGRKGPERLQKRFPIGESGPRQKRPMAFRIRNLKAQLDATAWTLHGSIEPVRPGHPWLAELRVAEIGEHGLEGDPLPVLNLKLEGPAEARIDAGVATITAPASTTSLKFSALAEPTPCVGALEVRVEGRVLSGDSR